MVFYDYLPKFSVTVIIFKDIVESVILLNDDACEEENIKTQNYHLYHCMISACEMSVFRQNI